MAIIRSSNYNGSYNNNTSTWTDGTAGWVIGGDGHAEFSSASIRGTLKAGSVFIDANNRWKTDELGNNAATSVFKVGSSNNYVYWDGATNLVVKGEIQATTGVIAGWTLGPGDILTTGGNFLGNMIIGEIEDGVRVGLEINGPSIYTPGHTGNTVILQYDYFSIGRASDGANVLISPSGDINASGTIQATHMSVDDTLTVYGTINGTVSNADTVDGYHANDDWTDGGSIPIRGGDASVGAQYFRFYGGVTGGGSSIIRRSDGYILLQSSKRELKTNIEDISGALDIISSLRPRSFNWKPQANDPDDIFHQQVKYSHKTYGFVVEEVSETSNELLEYTINNQSLEAHYWKPHDFIALSIQAIKDLMSQIDDLKSRIETLEAN